MMFGLFGAFAAVLWVPALIGLIALGVVLVRRSVSAPDWMLRGAACGGCGYELSSTGEGRCPECGGSLVKVGVTTPRMAARLRGSGYLLVMGWTIIVVMGCVPVLGAVSWMAMTLQMNQMNQAMAFTPSNAQQGTISGSIQPGMSIDSRGAMVQRANPYSISFNVTVETDETGQAASGSIDMTFLKVETPYDLSIDLEDLSWELADGNGAVVLEGPSFDKDAAGDVYVKVGLDTGDAKVRAESDYLATTVRDLQQAPQMFASGFGSPFDSEPLSVSANNSSWGPVGGGFTGGGFTGPSTSIWDYAGIGVFVVGGIVYVVGLVWLLRKRSRLFERAALG